MQLKIAVVGLKMGRAHAEICAALPEYELAALCDLDAELLQSTAQKLSIERTYADYEKMLSEVQPEAVVIATPTGLHAQMIRQAVDAGVQGIYCEKPIASNGKEAQEINALCEQAGVRVVIGHQRRVSDAYRTMRKLVQEGVIGDLRRIRATCPGDLLTDGTHLIDSALYLFGEDRPPQWVLGQVYRGKKATEAELRLNPFAYHGVRYGHPVEEGCMALIGMPGDARIELATGTVWQAEDGYQHLELIGSRGRILRPSDGASPAVLLDRGNGWETVSCKEKDMGLETAHTLSAQYFAHRIDDHPMSLAHALTGYALMMAVYESARRNVRLDLPCKMADDPLRKMLQDGRLE